MEWVRCNDSMQFEFKKEDISYSHNIQSTVAYHKHLTNKNCRALVYRYYPSLVRSLIFHYHFLLVSYIYTHCREITSTLVDPIHASLWH